MSGLARISGREVVKALQKTGYAEDRQRGSHIVLRRTVSPHRRVTVPDHKEVAKGTLIVVLPMKVVELVVEQQTYGWCPEELHFQHPYLTLGQIHPALAYYWDHREDLDRDIRRLLNRVDRLRSKNQGRAA